MTSSIKNKALFNNSAITYDKDFTFSAIGMFQRKRVYYWLNQNSFFSSTKKVFEINCGTGYDAEEFNKYGHQVFATDVSDSMIAYAKNNRSKNIAFKTASFTDVSKDSSLSNHDVLFSNFGGLNCIDKNQLTSFFREVNLKQKKGHQLVLVLMSKHCLVESLYFLFKLKFSKIDRRNTDKAVEVNVKDKMVKTYYYSPKEMINMLHQDYEIKLVKPIACFLPPSYLESFFKKRKKVLSFLNRMEQLFGRYTYLANWADHYIIIAEKR